VLPVTVLSIVAAPSLVSAGADMSGDEVLVKLREIQIAARQIKDHARKLQSMARIGSYPDTSHDYELNMIRDRINEAGKLVPELQKQTDIPTWQRDIIDDISGLLKAGASHTQTAFELAAEATEEELVVNRGYAARIAGLVRFADHIDMLVDYADTRKELKELLQETGQ
jgi:hypothetical protein